MKRLEYIEWLDHAGNGDGWVDTASCLNKPAICSSVGWITHEDKKCLTVASTWSGKQSWGGGFTILKSCIVKRVQIGRVRHK